MGQALFSTAGIPNRLLPAAVMLGTSTFTMSALPGTPSIQNAIPMPHFGTTAFAAPGLGLIAAAIMLGFGLWWLRRREVSASRAEETSATPRVNVSAVANDTLVRERATTAREFDPAEILHGKRSEESPPPLLAFLPLVVVIVTNLMMSFLVLPRMNTSFLAERRWGGITLSDVAGVWSVIVALASAITVVVLLNRERLRALRDTADAGMNASVLPLMSVASLVGFGSVVAALPAFATVRDWVLGVEGGPLVGLAVSTNVLAALTGSASGGLTIALGALGPTYMEIASAHGIDPALMHRVAVIGAGTLDSLPHNGAVVTLLAVCGATHKTSYLDIVVAVMIGPMIALAAVILLGNLFGSF
jgi:H+/gluconate symporter-like permease